MCMHICLHSLWVNEDKNAFRLKSLEPFVRHFMGQEFLDMLEVQKEGGVTSVVGKS
jgi:hypothetical protein